MFPFTRAPFWTAIFDPQPNLDEADKKAQLTPEEASWGVRWARRCVLHIDSVPPK